MFVCVYVCVCICVCVCVHVCVCVSVYGAYSYVNYVSISNIEVICKIKNERVKI
jgi:hypothetical protein